MSGAGRGLGRDRQPPSVRPHPRRHVWEMSPGGCRHRSQGSEVGMCSRHGTARAPLCRQINRVFLLRPRQAEGGFPEQSVGRVSEPTPFPKLLFNTPPTRQVFLRITIIKHSGEPGIVSREPTTEFAGPVDPGAGPLPRRGTWGVGVPGSGPQRHARTDRAVRQVVTCPLPMALAACGKRWTGGSCLHNPRPVHPRRVRPHAPALAHGSPRARGREGGGATRAPGPAAPPFPPGSASVLLSPLSLVHLSRALPRKVILTKGSHRTRVSLRFGQGQDGPQQHAGCLCPRATRNIRERERESERV